LPAIAAEVRKGLTFLYFEVDDLNAIKAAAIGTEIYRIERSSF